MKGILFDNIHSFTDLNLLLSVVDIPPAQPKTNYIDIPGGDGSVDLTEALGEVKFKDRECSFTFTAFPYENFEEKKKHVSNLLNGKRCRISVDKDPGFYWEGRCAVNEYASDKNLHKIVVGAVVSPYKLKSTQTVVTFNAGESVKKTLTNGRMTVVPTITNTENATIIFNGGTYTLNPGTHNLSNIVLKHGENIVTVTSASPVVFTYQEGEL